MNIIGYILAIFLILFTIGSCYAVKHYDKENRIMNFEKDSKDKYKTK